MGKTSAPKALKYAERLKLSDEDKKSRNNEFVVRRAENSLTQKILAQEEAIENKNIEKERYLEGADINFITLLNIDQDILDLNEGLKVLNAYKEELF